jgi:hypothetical protein
LEEKQEKLSEDELTSDKFEGKAQNGVRSRDNFRQVWRKSRKSCQKKSQLQTSLVKKQEKVAEDELTSDRFKGKEQKVVIT